MQSSASKRVAVVDFELVFDVWSLLFCCIRWQRPSLQTSDYSLLLYRPVEAALASTLTDISQRELVACKFEQLLLSVKPWIPSFQLIHALEKARYDVKFRSTIEPRYFMPLFSRLLDSKQFTSVSMMESGISLPDLLITCDQACEMEAKDFRRVRPRKLK